MHGREPVVGRPSPAYQRRVPGPGCVVMGPFADVRALAGRLLFRDCPLERRPPPARSLCEDRARRGSDARFRPQRAVGRDDREVVPSFVPMRGRPRRRVSLLLSESRVCRTRGRQLSASGRGGASATRHTPAGGRSRERLRSSRRRAPTSAAPGNRDVVAGQLADVDLTWADALLLRVLDHLKPLGEPSRASG